MAKDTGIVGVVGGGAGISGSVMAIGGLLLAPVTAGASLGLAIQFAGSFRSSYGHPECRWRRNAQEFRKSSKNLELSS